VLFALLTYRLEAETAAKRQAARAVQVRKVIKRRVVTTVVGGSGGTTAGSASAASSPVAGSVAPEPEPEPVVTSSS
jgi:hypothetical protein